MDEHPLIGGNISDATRVGDTVRRRAGPHTAAVHALLRHLEGAGFPAPRPLGIDDRAREILSYIEGDVEPGWPDPQPDWVFSLEALRASGRMLRRFHDITTTFVSPPGAHWRSEAPTAHEVICHNDWSPANMVFRDGLPVAVLDWDGAGPGSRAWDVGGAAYWWVPLIPNHERFDLQERARRLALLCDAYGEMRPSDALDALIGALPVAALNIERFHAAGDPGFKKLAVWDVPDRLRREAATLAEQRAVLSGAR